MHLIRWLLCLSVGLLILWFCLPVILVTIFLILMFGNSGGGPQSAAAQEAETAQRLADFLDSTNQMQRGAIAELSEEDRERARISAVTSAVQGGMHMVRTMIAEYESREGEFPHSLEALVTAGYLREIPRFPSPYALSYDGGTGELSVFCYDHEQCISGYEDW